MQFSVFFALLAFICSASAYNVYLRERCFSVADCDRFYSTVNGMCMNDECRSRNSRVYGECKSSLSRGTQYTYDFFYTRPHQRNLNSGKSFNEIAFTEADCRRFQQELSGRCRGNSECESINWRKYYECSESVNERRRNYNWSA
ncbi:hypothetical protein HDU97_007422 [Phlyctochytrium planicorne]|nr:hypothetical protein HDU97_007422 [Phlyctochytrium planicorne]